MENLKKIIEKLTIKRDMLINGEGWTNKLFEFINKELPFYWKENYNTSIDYILYQINKNEFNINPSYQREYLWNNIQKENLIKSILLEIPIPHIIVNYLWDNIWKYNLIDWKQRITTLIKFINNEFNINGLYFKDMPDHIKNKISNFQFSVIWLKINEELEKEYYNIYNYSGSNH